MQSEEFISQEHGGAFKSLHLLLEYTHYFDLQTYFITIIERKKLHREGVGQQIAFPPSVTWFGVRHATSFSTVTTVPSTNVK